MSRFVADESGNVAILFALCGVVLFGAGGLALDYAMWNSARTQMQEAADAGALAGASELAIGGANAATRAETKALKLTDSNRRGLIETAVETIDVDTAAKTVRVDLAMSGKRSLSAILLNADPDLFASSTAIVGAKTVVCIYALNGAASPALSGNGSAILEGTNCAIHVNSSAAGALANSGTIEATSICVVGGYSGSGYTPTPQTSCPVAPDPFLSVTIPAAGACTYSGLSINSDSTLYPGTYCGGLQVTGGAMVSLQPGDYHFVDGPVKIASGASMTGSGVAFILHGTASLDIAGSGEVSTTPPTSGPLTGMSVVQDRTAPLGGVSKITGEGRFNFPGAIYLPRQALEVAGRAAGNTFTPTYAAIVADTIKISGQGEISATADTSLLGKEYAQALTTAMARLSR